MRNPCTRCLELDFCREGRWGVPCRRREIFNENTKAIRRQIAESMYGHNSGKGGGAIEENKGKRQIRKGNP